MPDLMVHMALGIVLARLCGVERRDRWVLLLGCVLPDLNILAFLAALALRGPMVATAVSFPLHTPLGALAFALLAASFIDRDLWRAYWLVAAGALSNLLLDSLAFPWARPHHFLLLWPLSWEPVGVPLAASMGALSWALVAAAAAVLAKERLG